MVKFMFTGCQSLFDICIKDNFHIAQFSASTFCLIAIFSRFSFLSQLSTQNLLFLTLVCTVYVFAFVMICVNSGFLFIVRTICLVNMNFMEETIGKRFYYLNIDNFCNSHDSNNELQYNFYYKYKQSFY